MPRFTADGEAAINEIAQRHRFTTDAVSSMLESILAGHGRMAQFNHPEFGGAGQWMRGGMMMISDMFDSTLKARVERLCDELARLIVDQAASVSERAEPRNQERYSTIFADAQAGRDEAGAPAAAEPSMFFAPLAGAAKADWWPADLGRPDSAGAQNDMRYAYFAAARRLAIAAGNRVTVYDTLDHRISGVAQQQSGRGSLTLSSQHGVVDVATLPVVSGGGEPESGRGEPASGRGEPVSGRGESASGRGESASVGRESVSGGGEGRAASDDIVATIEKLAELHRKGILNEPEFAAKKAELLSRL